MRLLPSLKPLVWQSLSAASLAVRRAVGRHRAAHAPGHHRAGLARRDRRHRRHLWRGRSNRRWSRSGFSASAGSTGISRTVFPISLIRPGFSSGAGGRRRLALQRRGRSGAACWAGAWTPSERTAARLAAAPPAASATPAAIISIDNAAAAVASMRPGQRNGIVGSIEHDIERNPKRRTGKALHDRLQIIRNATIEPKHQHGGSQRHPQPQMLLDPDPDPFAIAVEQDRDHEEASAARDRSSTA